MMTMKMKRLSGLVILRMAAGKAGATNGYFLSGYGTNSKAEAGVGIATREWSLLVRRWRAPIKASTSAVLFRLMPMADVRARGTSHSRYGSSPPPSLPG
jgi:hypothetical protein